jgi:CelD/BcsL family acetyltransferase involved in cellulose biosynthesis
MSCYWHDGRLSTGWKHVFLLPKWLETWWRHFGADFQLTLCSVQEKEALIGIAPLMVRGETAFLIGSPDVCDYLDFVVTPGKEQAFFAALLNHWKNQGIDRLDLTPVRVDSTVCTHLVQVARDSGFDVSCNKEDVSLELELPATWNDYLHLLKGKQRHEIRRKFRRLHEAADISFRVIDAFNDIKQVIELFFTIFIHSREDKARFMTERMNSFFRDMVDALSQLKLLKFYLLELNRTPAAMAMCFDYNATVFLYNSGYDRRFESLSVGLLCKALSIQESIRDGKKRYDFLKGAEGYKHRMGGREVPLYRFQIRFR